MFKKIKRLLSIIKYFFEDEDTLFFYLLEKKAYESMKDCAKLEVGSTEELEDLLFHLKIYKEIPMALTETKYPKFRGSSVKDVIQRFKQDKMTLQEIEEYGDYLVEVETQRAVERDIIFDHAKVLPFGFSL